MKLRSGLVAAWLSGALYVTGLPARADTVVLKNGNKYIGKIKSADSKVVVIRSDGIDWTLPADTIASQTRDDKGLADATDSPRKDKSKGRDTGAPVPQNGRLVLWFDDSTTDTWAVRRTWTLNHFRWEERDLTKHPEWRQSLCDGILGLPNMSCLAGTLVIEYRGKFYNSTSQIYFGLLPRD